MSDPTTPEPGADGTSTSAPETATAQQLWDEFDAADSGKTGQSDRQVRVSETDDQGNEVAEDFEEEGAKSPPADLPADGKEAASAKTDNPPKDDDRDAQIERLQHQLKSERGRRESAQRDLMRLQQRVADGTEDVKERRQSAAASKARQEQIDKAKTDFPDAVAPLAEELSERAKRDAKELKRQERELREDSEALRSQLRENQSAFLKEHPDGFDFVKDNWDVFEDWIEDQPRDVRDGFKKNREAIVDPVGAAHTIALFKREMAKQGVKPAGEGKGKSGNAPKETPLDSKRQQQLRGAQDTRTKQVVRTQQAPPEGASREDHWAYFEELDRRRDAANR